jgi:hypothetical protein
MLHVIGCKYEFVFGDRVGNVGWDSKSKGKHMIMVNDVVFYVRLATSPETIQALFSYELKTHNVTTQQCGKIVFTHVSGKNFGGAKGAVINTLDRQVSPEADGPFISMMMEFALVANHHPTDFFFSRTSSAGFNKKFTNSQSAKAAKESAGVLGLPMELFSTTSWRAGWSSAMGAAGFEDAELKLHKKHTSNASFLYNRPTGKRVNAGRVASLSVDDVDSMVPVGARRRLADQRTDEDVERTNRLLTSLQSLSSAGALGVAQEPAPLEVLKISVPRALVFKRTASVSGLEIDGGIRRPLDTCESQTPQQIEPSCVQSSVSA